MAIPQSLTPATKSYVNAVYRLQSDGTEVTTQRLAVALGRSPASNTNMSKRLHKAQIVHYTRYHRVVLTDHGLQIARSLQARRRVLEHYLREVLGFDANSAGEEAERLELYVSDRLEARIRRILTLPKTTTAPEGCRFNSESLS